jgi:ABC-type uncharacterized transport system ATPase subunit
VKDFSLILEAGEILGIRGRREAGLETLELCLSGFLQPSRGSIEGDRPVYLGPGTSELSPAAPELSIFDNLVIKKMRAGFPRKNQSRKSLEAWAASRCRSAGINANLGGAASSLSGGMLTRLIMERELAAVEEGLAGTEGQGSLPRATCERFASHSCLLSTPPAFPRGRGLGTCLGGQASPSSRALLISDSLPGLDEAAAQKLAERVRGFAAKGGALIIILEADIGLERICDVILELG